MVIINSRPNFLQTMHLFIACPSGQRAPATSSSSHYYRMWNNLQVTSHYTAVWLQKWLFSVLFFCYKIDHFDHFIEHTEILQKHHLYKHRKKETNKWASSLHLCPKWKVICITGLCLLFNQLFTNVSREQQNRSFSSLENLSSCYYILSLKQLKLASHLHHLFHFFMTWSVMGIWN